MKTIELESHAREIFETGLERVKQGQLEKARRLCPEIKTTL